MGLAHAGIVRKHDFHKRCKDSKNQELSELNELNQEFSELSLAIFSLCDSCRNLHIYYAWNVQGTVQQGKIRFIMDHRCRSMQEQCDQYWFQSWSTHGPKYTDIDVCVVHTCEHAICVSVGHSKRNITNHNPSAVSQIIRACYLQCGFHL